MSDAETKVLAIGGEPATGKTTLVREILRRYGARAGVALNVSQRTLRWVELGNLVVLGVYAEGERFAGTDRLSMAVQPEAEQWLRAEVWSDRHRLVLFEGDRLFNAKFLRALRGIEEIGPLKLDAWVLRADDDELIRRHEERGDKQTDQWLRGRRTKVANIVVSHELGVVEQRHVTAEDTERLATAVLAMIP